MRLLSNVDCKTDDVIFWMSERTELEGDSKTFGLESGAAEYR